MTALADLRDSRELVYNLTLREIRGKYRRTVLGHAWSLINPLASLLIFTAVFGVLLRLTVPVGHPSGLKVFALWLTCGLLPWNFFNNAVSFGMGSLVANSNLVSKVYFPREVLVGSLVFSWDLTLAIELSVLSAVMLAWGAVSLAWLPVALLFGVVLTAFALGIGLVLAVANVYFRDTSHLVNILMQIWFYATPVVYPLSYVKQAQIKLDAKNIWPFHHHWPIQTIYQLNPMERFLEVFRALLYDNRWPDWQDSVYCVVAATLTLVVGYAIFRRYEGRLAEEL